MELINTKAYMERLRAAKDVESYAVFVYDHGEETLITSPNVNGDTYFDCASMGKVLVTSTLILRAAGEGRLSLDDTLPRFFADVPADKRDITVRMLLTHTSGILRRDFDKATADAGKDAITAYILSVPLGFAPGTDYTYSCSGYILLGYIAEKCYGMPLDTLYLSTVRPALGLPDMCFDLPIDAPNAADCCRRREIGDCRCDDELVSMMHGVAGNGASFWTMNDMRVYLHAVMTRSPSLYDARFFDEAETNLTPTLSEGRGLGYLVINERYKQGGRLFPVGSFGHCGHTGQSFFVDRAHDRYVVLLTDATRCEFRKNNDRDDYGVVMRMRAAVHDRIAEDLADNGRN